MFTAGDYGTRGYNFLNNHLFPEHKRLSSLMIYATDLCDSACKHCLIWAKRPVTHLPADQIFNIMKSRCIRSSTRVGLEGGEFMLHPEALAIMKWFRQNHPNYDLLSNCLKPDELINAVREHRPGRLYISLDGDEATYRHMRGKDGYGNVLQVIRALKETLPVFVMFTLSPYNNFDDLQHVAELCESEKVFLRVGIYNNIPFFDTLEDAGATVFGQLKTDEVLTISEVKRRRESANTGTEALPAEFADDYEAAIPEVLKHFGENYDYVKLYPAWRQKKLRLRCFSILDSLIVLPNGDVPICQNLPTLLGNIYEKSLDDIFNSAETHKVQQHHSHHCNQCWISYHRKYDIALYRNFEKFFGPWATRKMLGYYRWTDAGE